MPRAIGLCVAIFAFVGITHAQIPALQIDGTRQVVGVALRDEVQFNPKTCKRDSGNLYVALGTYVFAMPSEDQNKYIYLPLNETSLVLKVPDPGEPAGCWGNPFQLLGHRIANRLFSASVGPAPDVLTLYRLDRSRLAESGGQEWLGEISQLRFANHFFDGGNCREGFVQADITEQLTGCRIKLANPPKARQEDWATSYRAKVYSTPLGRPFVVNCDALLFSDVIGSCRVAYVLMAGLGVSYNFQPYRGRLAIPIERIVDFDRSLRSLIELARTCHPCRCRKGRWSRFSDGCGSGSPSARAWRQRCLACFCPA
jgi:hypothetical protein